jgi:hypothetical protein
LQSVPPRQAPERGTSVCGKAVTCSSLRPQRATSRAPLETMRNNVSSDSSSVVRSTGPGVPLSHNTQGVDTLVICVIFGALSHMILSILWRNSRTMAALDQFNFSEALLRPVRVLQFGVFSPEEVVRSPRLWSEALPCSRRNRCCHNPLLLVLCPETHVRRGNHES